MLVYLEGGGHSQAILIWSNAGTKNMSRFNVFQPTLDTKLSYSYHKNLRGKSVAVLLPMSKQNQSLVDWNHSFMSALPPFISRELILSQFCLYYSYVMPHC